MNFGVYSSCSLFEYVPDGSSQDQHASFVGVGVWKTLCQVWKTALKADAHAKAGLYKDRAKCLESRVREMVKDVVRTGPHIYMGPLMYTLWMIMDFSVVAFGTWMSFEQFCWCGYLGSVLPWTQFPCFQKKSRSQRNKGPKDSVSAFVRSTVHKVNNVPSSNHSSGTLMFCDPFS